MVARLQRLGERGAGDATSACSLERGGNPRMIWLRITPLLPRAPISEPWLMASHVAVEIVGGRRLHLGHDRVECAGHVRAGVAVGNRVHVETVESAGVRPHRVTEGADGVAKGGGVQPFECGTG